MNFILFKTKITAENHNRIALSPPDYQRSSLTGIETVFPNW